MKRLFSVFMAGLVTLLAAAVSMAHAQTPATGEPAPVTRVLVAHPVVHALALRLGQGSGIARPMR